MNIFGRLPVLILSLSITALNIVRAQSFDAGLRFGMTATQVGGDQLEGFDKAGLLAGGYVSRDISQRSSIAMEMIFIQKGSRKPLDKTDNSYYLMRLNYIEVPLVFRWKASKKFILETGPSFSVLVSSYEADQLGELVYAPPFEKTDVSVHAGLLYVLTDRWNVNVRYGFSVLPVRPLTPALSYRYIDSGQFNEVLQLALNYTF
jgi:hypothetical protein